MEGIALIFGPALHLSCVTNEFNCDHERGDPDLNGATTE